MRATAESHGKVIERIDGGDTVWRWHRDPLVAEAMVGRSAGDSTTLRVLTLTADEAVQRHFSEGSASSVAEVLQRAGVEDYTLYVYEPTTLDRVLGWLMNPVAQGIFIMLIIGGIYFELQTPGIGFPLVVAVLGAVLYFAPLYLEGVAQNWELLLFVVDCCCSPSKYSCCRASASRASPESPPSSRVWPLRRSTTNCSVTLPRARCRSHGSSGRSP